VTQRLYYTDSYLRTFEASIVDRSEEGKRVYLNRTAFYPTAGGQPCDTGWLGGVEVTEVVDEGERIAHLLAESNSADTVRGEVNWARRFDHMQQHTGQHLLSAVLADLLGHTTVGVHIGPDTSNIDLTAEQITAEQISRAEERANQIVTENRPVEIGWEDAASASGLRKAPDRVGIIRIITIENLDRSACGGTHVQATGEIGCILLRKLDRVRKGVRLEFLCGLRAVRRARSETEVLSRLAAEYSASVKDLPQLATLQRAELKQAGSARRQLESVLSDYQARELYAATASNAAGLRQALVRKPSGTLDQLRGLAQAFASLPGAVFVGAIDQPPAVLLSASADSGIHAGRVLRGILDLVGGRGGGSAALAQGTLSDQTQLDRVIASLPGPE
jgi:alanyl-tRNA synthetase